MTAVICSTDHQQTMKEKLGHCRLSCGHTHMLNLWENVSVERSAHAKITWKQIMIFKGRCFGFVKWLYGIDEAVCTNTQLCSVM